MKPLFVPLKEILQDNMEDLLFLLFVGVPSGILMILISPCFDYSNLH